MWRAGIFSIAPDLKQPASVLQVRGHHAAAQKYNAMLVEFFVRPRGAESLQIVRRRVGMEMNREQLALDQVGLRRLPQPNGDIGFAHREVQLLLRGNQRDVDVRIEIQKFIEPRREPMHPDARRGLYLQLAIRPLPAVGELGARRFELHEDFMRGAVEQFALLGENQPARMAMKQGYREL